MKDLFKAMRGQTRTASMFTAAWRAATKWQFEKRSDV